VCSLLRGGDAEGTVRIRYYIPRTSWFRKWKVKCKRLQWTLRVPSRVDGRQADAQFWWQNLVRQTEMDDNKMYILETFRWEWEVDKTGLRFMTNRSLQYWGYWNFGYNNTHDENKSAKNLWQCDSSLKVTRKYNRIPIYTDIYRYILIYLTVTWRKVIYKTIGES
jgi:hypothetical protein